MGNRFLQKYIAVLLRKSEMSKKKLHTYCILEGHLHFYLDKVMVRATLGGFWETWGGLWGGLGRTLGRLLGGLEGLGGTRRRRREKEEATQQKQEEKRKKQHKRSSKREGRSNAKEARRKKGEPTRKEKQKIYIYIYKLPINRSCGPILGIIYI